jgi:predicted nucleotidyltransferase
MKQRFLAHPTQASVVRREAVRGYLTDASRLHAEVLGATLYGSAARGDARPDSDIDGYVFISVDLLPESARRRLVYEHGEPELAPALRKVHRLAIDHYFANRGFSERQVHDFRPLPIGAALLERELDALAAEATRPEGYRQDAYYPPRVLYGLFHQEIGEGLRPFRERVLEYLLARDAQGELMWQSILTSTESMEQHLSNGETAGYPQTVREAIEMYGAERLMNAW